jgi:hypothetical protein
MISGCGYRADSGMKPAGRDSRTWLSPCSDHDRWLSDPGWTGIVARVHQLLVSGSEQGEPDEVQTANDRYAVQCS